MDKDQVLADNGDVQGAGPNEDAKKEAFLSDAIDK
jgi:hypothetical protein